jgi:hypothetical protein
MSEAMLDEAQRRLAAHADRLSGVLFYLLDPSWPRHLGGPFDLGLRHRPARSRPPQKDLRACPAMHGLLRPGGYFLNYDRFVGGVKEHLTELRAAGFGRVECVWQQPPHAIVVAARTDR